MSMIYDYEENEALKALERAFRQGTNAYNASLQLNKTHTRSRRARARIARSRQRFIDLKEQAEGSINELKEQPGHYESYQLRQRHNAVRALKSNLDALINERDPALLEEPSESPRRSKTRSMVFGSLLLGSAALGVAGYTLHSREQVVPVTPPAERRVEPALPTPIENIVTKVVKERSIHGSSIPYLMLHKIGPEPDRYTITPEQLREGVLPTLYANNFRPVSPQEVRNDDYRALKPGSKPVVLTFDDSSEGQFRYVLRDDRWIIDPDCAVGILSRFNEAHPDFRLRGIFAIDFVDEDNRPSVPFGQPDLVTRKLYKLHELGFDIYSHTATHADLSTLALGAVRDEIKSFNSMLSRYVDLERLPIRGIAYPYGAKPSTRVREYLSTIYDEQLHAWGGAYRPKGDAPTPRIELSGGGLGVANLEQYLLRREGLMTVVERYRVEVK